MRISKLSSKVKKVFVGCMMVGAVGMTVLCGISYSEHKEGEKVNTDKVLEDLMKGNEHFVAGKLELLQEHSTPTVRASLATGQKPSAIILACSDSRVAPELLFDKGLGEIFVVRVAGNVVSPHELGSIEYAVEHLGARLIMVVGHERCGAVTAAVQTAAPNCSENIGSLLCSIKPAVDEANKLLAGKNADEKQVVETAIEENVKVVAKNLESQSAILKEMVEKEGLKIVGGKYDLDDGKVTLIKLGE